MAGWALKRELEMIFTASRRVKHLAILILLVGIHNLSLGIFIYFFTELFYRIFFQVEIENIFFVRQAGLFMFCLGLFYLSPLIDLKNMNRLVILLITTKVLAFVFLLMNACLSSKSAMIFLAAAGDGSMALLLFVFYRMAHPWLKESESDRQ